MCCWGLSELKQLAGDSLQLLAAALSSCAVQFPALFDLRVFGSIIGMFELNNLGDVPQCCAVKGTFRGLRLMGD